MKIKLKLTIEQLNNLIIYANDFLQRKKNLLSTLEEINLKSFIRFGMKKVILAEETQTHKEKLKTFSIDVNIIEALRQCLWVESENLNPLNLALYLDMQEQIRLQTRKYNLTLHL